MVSIMFPRTKMRRVLPQSIHFGVKWSLVLILQDSQVKIKRVQGHISVQTLCLSKWFLRPFGRNPLLFVSPIAIYLRIGSRILRQVPKTLEVRKLNNLVRDLDAIVSDVDLFFQIH